MRRTAGQPLERPAEHEFEAAHGLPEALPANERLLWQGSPDAWGVTRDALHIRAIGAYFAVLLAARGGAVLAGGGSAVDAALAMVWLLPLAIAGLALIGTFGWLVARTSVYTLTDRRVVMRIGIVLSVTFNLPYRQIESAAFKPRADGSGDLTLLLDVESRIAYLHLWPHARPWELRRSQPMLRALPEAAKVAALLAEGLRASVTRASKTATAARAPATVAPARALAPATATATATATFDPATAAPAPAKVAVPLPVAAVEWPVAAAVQRPGPSQPAASGRQPLPA